ncbi:MAG: glycoside hydrolase family 3 C-terminal domain-containing protein [Terriglobia bacterium]
MSPFAVWAAGQPSQKKPSPAEIDHRVDAMLAKLTLAQKIKLIGGDDGMFIHAMPSIGLPRLKMSDGPLGVRTWGPSTAYAAGIGLAASWDVSLAKQLGISLGRDARARGVNFLLGPAVNIYRAPMDGRNFEYFGEDPYLAGQIAANYILGVQSQGVAATVKHYAADNSEYDTPRENVIVDKRTLREIYLPAFEAAVKEGHVAAVMDSYNLVNGEHSTQNKFLDTEVLKEEWGFRGILMSDWGATHNGIAAANAGLDLEMPVPQYINLKTLLPAIKSGQVSLATINDKVRRILRVAVEFGFINHNQQDLSIPLASRRSRAVALHSAEESMVLLKNQGNLLPLAINRIHSIAVIGPDAYPANVGGGGSSHVTAFAPVSFLMGIEDALGPGVKVYWSRGVTDVQKIFKDSSFVMDRKGTQPGLEQEEFSSVDFSGKPISEFRVARLDARSFSRVPPGQRVRSVRWSGYYIPKSSGPQRFIAAVGLRDAYRLFVDGKLVLDVPENGGIPPRAVDIDLPAGRPAAVRLDYLPDSDNIRARLGIIPVKDVLQPNVRKIAAIGDVVVLCVGFNEITEGEGHDRSYRLPPAQNALIKAVAAANPRTIVVLTAGGSVATAGWLDRVPVLLQTWYSGSEGGHALAAVLTGKANPSGKLPITWWRRVEDDPAYKNYYEEPGTHKVEYREGIFIGYRACGHNGQPAPLFPFGYGLSYTRFAFSDLSVTPKEASVDGPVTVRFDVQNIGRRTGAEVAQVYVGDPSSTVPRPIKELKGFERVVLEPGETRRVSITLNKRSLAYWNTQRDGWTVDLGKFVVYVGDSSENTPLQMDFNVR